MRYHSDTQQNTGVDSRYLDSPWCLRTNFGVPVAYGESFSGAEEFDQGTKSQSQPGAAVLTGRKES